MTLSDIINGCFELFGGVFVLNHCRAVLRDKKVAGVSIISSMFFLSWGIWNLYYYPVLNQWCSFVGGIFLALTNAFWISLLIYYRNQPPITIPTKPNREIERKFLLLKTEFFNHVPIRSIIGKRKITQGFLTKDPVIRIRKEEVDKATSYYLTIKGSGLVSRSEYEMKIGEAMGEELLKNFCGKTIIKWRWLVQSEDHIWEIDEFMEDLLGLWVAEIELYSEDEEFEIPPWIGKEVSNDPRYTNVKLIDGGIPDAT